MMTFPSMAEDCVDTKQHALPPCRVCGDQGAGFHYGVNTCEACKGFFHRSLKVHHTYRCTGNGACDLKKIKRQRCCQYCRYHRCVQVGMSKEAIKTGRYTSYKKASDIMEIKKLGSFKNSQLFSSQDSSFHTDSSSKESPTDGSTEPMETKPNTALTIASSPSEMTWMQTYSPMSVEAYDYSTSSPQNKLLSPPKSSPSHCDSAFTSPSSDSLIRSPETPLHSAASSSVKSEFISLWSPGANSDNVDIDCCAKQSNRNEIMKCDSSLQTSTYNNTCQKTTDQTMYQSSGHFILPPISPWADQHKVEDSPLLCYSAGSHQPNQLTSSNHVHQRRVLEIFADKTEAIKQIREGHRQYFSVLFQAERRCQELTEQQKIHAEECENKIKIFGRMNFIPESEYDEIWKTTGLDIDNRKELLKNWETSCELLAYALIMFSKNLPGFTLLDLPTQADLIKSARPEVNLLNSMSLFNTELNVGIWAGGVQYCHKEFGQFVHHDFFWTYTTTCRRVQSLNLTAEERAVIKAILVFSTDRDGVSILSPIPLAIQWQLIECLEFLLAKRFPRPKLALATIIQCLTDLRTIRQQALDLLVSGFKLFKYSHVLENPFLKELLSDVLYLCGDPEEDFRQDIVETGDPRGEH